MSNNRRTFLGRLTALLGASAVVPAWAKLEDLENDGQPLDALVDANVEPWVRAMTQKLMDLCFRLRGDNEALRAALMQARDDLRVAESDKEWYRYRWVELERKSRIKPMGGVRPAEPPPGHPYYPPIVGEGTVPADPAYWQTTSAGTTVKFRAYDDVRHPTSLADYEIVNTKGGS